MILIVIGILFETMKQLVPSLSEMPDLVSLLISFSWSSLTT
jgi:hypothetical protein